MELGDWGARLSEAQKKQIAARMRNRLEKGYVLSFNKEESLFVEEDQLDAISGATDSWGKNFTPGTQYKNVKSNTQLQEQEFYGKKFLINDVLQPIEWKLESETKNIGNYTCFKATAVRPVSQSDFRNFRRKKEDVKKEENESDTKTEEKKEAQTTNFMDQWEMPKEIEVVAWYTPDIPISQGPENYWGLPGLILEVSDGKTVILCSKIVMNPKEKKEIKAPKKGKVVSQQEYDKIVAEKMEEWREMGRQGGGGFRMGR